MSLLRLGRAVARPFIAAGQGYNAMALKAPFTTGVVTTVLKTSLADLIVQKVVENKKEVDWRRQGVFVAFGFAYLGCFQYYLYNNVFSRLCAPITRVLGHMGVAPVKVFLDQAIHHPFVYFPFFYTLKGTVEGRPLAISLAMCRDEMWENCKALWSLWVPMQLINFAVVPKHLRIPFVAGISLAWCIVLSAMRGADPSHVGEDHLPAVPAVPLVAYDEGHGSEGHSGGGALAACSTSGSGTVLAAAPPAAAAAGAAGGSAGGEGSGRGGWAGARVPATSGS